MNKRQSLSRTVLIQDLGIFLFMFSFLCAGLITALSGRSLIYQNVAIMLGMIFAAVLIVLRAKVAGTLVSGGMVLVFAVYKLYMHFSHSETIEPGAYFWPVLIITSMAGMHLFIELFSTVEGVNSLLNQRIDELTVMDPVTGLENMRSMINTLKRTMALSQRNDTPVGLMMVRIRYADEIRKVLSKQQFDTLRGILAQTLEDVLRLEDRIFTIDNNGSFGIIYFSLESGVPFIRNRILAAVAGKDMLPDLNSQMLTLELSIVSRQYSKEYGKDAMRFISDVEKEFAYEV